MKPVVGSEGQFRGADGRSVEFRTTDTHIQWRYTGGGIWSNLTELTTLTGEQGMQGLQGIQGVKGDPGDTGPAGPANLKVQNTNPGLTQPGLWVQTGLGATGTDFTIWIEDGVGL